MHITNDAKPSLQCTEAAKKATQALGFVKRTFSHFDCPSFSTLYKTYVRPHMEFAVGHFHIKLEVQKMQFLGLISSQNKISCSILHLHSKHMVVFYKW